MSILGGIDIGGTKCAIVIGKSGGSANSTEIDVVGKISFPTPATPQLAMEQFIRSMEQLMDEHHIEHLEAIGISCGGPLDSKKGLILSPPNLPHWDGIDVVSPLRRHFGVPVGLQNDANACALAEWKWGAGQGSTNMVFLTFGTGMGAGLIIDGKLYSGTNDMAGEVGHVRMEDSGPVGYGKAGSFEGFCSGGGIAQLGKSMAKQWIEGGKSTSFCPSLHDIDGITAKQVGEAAQAGDELALLVYELVGRKLAQGLAILVDILNPERIVIGSIYARQKSLLEPIVMDEIKKEALSQSLEVCRIVPAGLDESVGDLASLSVALNVLAG